MCRVLSTLTVTVANGVPLFACGKLVTFVVCILILSIVLIVVVICAVACLLTALGAESCLSPE
jgi:hypothetical protein